MATASGCSEYNSSKRVSLADCPKSNPVKRKSAGKTKKDFNKYVMYMRNLKQRYAEEGILFNWAPPAVCECNTTVVSTNPRSVTICQT